MKYYSTFAIFKNTWDQVACAYWQKYPNPYSKHVITEDLISRTVAGKKLISTRLLTKTNRLPKWGYGIFGNNAQHVCIVEESVVDPEKKSMTTYTHNIGYQKFMVVIEKCTYTPSDENKEWTECRKEAWIGSNLTGFSSLLSKFGYERFKANAPRSTKGLQYVIDRLFVPETIPNSNVASQLTISTGDTLDRLTDAAKVKKAQGVAATKAMTDVAMAKKAQGVAATKAKVQEMSAKAKSQTVPQL
ncbi:PRELI domain-containing protein 1, mitochondrial-like [Amphiura filiformis]|uniref:PRELI domain-containing protein 1, mitochondrial-like n=1 Tax=Amphiura filiformis TaxID=82378 RepID=UPI003B21F35A